MMTIDAVKCIQCKACIEVCPNYVFACHAGGAAEVEIAHPEQCCLCGHCVAVCPEGAIRHGGMPPEEFREVPHPRVSGADMRDILLSRRSIRAFQEKPVPRELLEQLIETATHAGTASNAQTEDFIVIQNRHLLSELEELVIEILWKAGLKYLGSRLGRTLVELKYGRRMVRQYVAYHHIMANRKRQGQLRGMIFRNAPVVVISHGLKTNFLAHTNCAIATRNMEIMAPTLGLGTCWVGFLTSAAHISRRIGKCLGVPPDRKIYGAIMAGYPKHRYGKRIPRRRREVCWL
ncbi:MAG: nitroreductase family protein [Phycisphaerales bacterium]|nr:MAG: nitroreductase family protein [Phycisphaerales bacterium]